MQIDASFLQRILKQPVYYFDCIDSTSSHLERLIKSDRGFEGIVIAGMQTKGRGRVGKTFYSPENSGLYLTFSFNAQRFCSEDLTPAIALAVCKAIEENFAVSCGVKWVNDIYVDDKKVGGVLCQLVSDYLLIGIGINVTKPKIIPRELENRLGWICDSAASSVAHQLIQSLYEQIVICSRMNSSDLLKDYRNRCVHIGKNVEIEADNTLLQGKCVGIGDDFSLLVEMDGIIQNFSSGYMVLKI